MVSEDLLFYIGPSAKASLINIHLSRDWKLVKLPESRAFQTERTEVGISLLYFKEYQGSQYV